MQQRLDPPDYELAKLAIESYITVTKVAREQGTTIRRLRRLIGMQADEKTAAVFPNDSPPGAEGGQPQRDDRPSAGIEHDGDSNASQAASKNDDGNSATKPATTKKKRKGHGRVPVEDYTNATHIPVGHGERLQPGQICPNCNKGKLYDLNKPAR